MECNLVKTPLTSDDVLLRLREWQRLLMFTEFAPVSMPLADFGTTMHQWMEWAIDAGTWRSAAHAFNKVFETRIPLKTWRGVLTPPKQKTLGGVCRLLAEHAEVPSVEPITILGRSCAPAGAFLLVRSLLARAGADVRSLAPSTSLAPYLRRHMDVFVDIALRIAPWRLPGFKVSSPFQRRAVSWLLKGLLLVAVITIFDVDDPFLALECAALMTFGFAGASGGAR